MAGVFVFTGPPQTTQLTLIGKAHKASFLVEDQQEDKGRGRRKSVFFRDEPPDRLFMSK